MGTLTISDMFEISNLIHKLGYNEGNITIECKVKDRHELSKVNEEFFYKFHPTDPADNSKIDPNPDEVDIRIGGLRFRYFTETEEES